MTSYDAIIIGGGHNGLVAAAMLAKSGRSTVCIEASDRFGGGAVTREFHPGFRVSGPAHLLNRLAPEVERALGLDLSRLGSRLASTVALGADGEAVMLDGAYGARLRGVSDAEAGKFAELRALLLSQAGILKRFQARRPPMPGKFAVGDIVDFGLAGLSLLRHGRDFGRDFARMLLMNVADVLDEHLTDDRLKGLLAFDATLGVHLGPRSPTSLMGLYYRLAGESLGAAGGQIVPKGGIGAVTDLLVGAAKSHGADLRSGARVSRILISSDGVTGVELADGARLVAPVIVSAIHPGVTFGGLLPPGEVDTGLSTAIRNIRSKGDAAKLHLALDRIPDFAGVAQEDLSGRLVIAPSIDQVERAFNPAKYGEFSPEPVMEIVLPSVSDPSMAPEGKASLSAVIQFAPYALKQGWETGRAAFLDRALDRLEAHAPGLKSSVLAAELLVPPDIEQIYAMPGGHWHHGELQVDQMLFNRPAYGASGYDTPVSGLFLASAGSHPGGGISGLPGYNAARHILSKGGVR
ncbi:phytoene dehydrogenase-like protein [Rhizobium sp. SG_E_25_P2]|uniref:phytoene desaturase family protein n=1 Tax=Rhizobium sp. SG_E_25_P2 TaxID=2879942 RepID=UPI002473AB46|nr:NAD(P)/FAD-dependent oxidoreductase [Rhizobium sp. SG_E_25_P2]MDH6266347.1 phytoene dehydrogenase-like protein [Rhizobium sp. SG_E_25_P2]